MFTTHTSKTLLGCLTLMAVLVVTAPALAMNDPATGRWVTRDPLHYNRKLVANVHNPVAPLSVGNELRAPFRRLARKRVAANLYHFLDSRATVLRDPLGLCDDAGHPGQFGWTECQCGVLVPCVSSTFQDQPFGLSDCVSQHEECHTTQPENQDWCSNHPNDAHGVLPANADIECPCYFLEIVCLDATWNNCPDGSQCRLVTACRVRQLCKMARTRWSCQNQGGVEDEFDPNDPAGLCQLIGDDVTDQQCIGAYPGSERE